MPYGVGKVTPLRQHYAVSGTNARDAGTIVGDPAPQTALHGTPTTCLRAFSYRSQYAQWYRCEYYRWDIVSALRLPMLTRAMTGFVCHVLLFSAYYLESRWY
eukprot:942896-Rhodomonas_salina.3